MLDQGVELAATLDVVVIAVSTAVLKLFVTKLHDIVHSECESLLEQMQTDSMVIYDGGVYGSDSD